MNSQYPDNLGLVHTYPFMFENGDFFLQFGLTSTRIRWKRHQKHTSFQKRSPEWWTCFRSWGRTKRNVFENEEGHTSYSQCPISVLCGRAKNHSNLLRVAAYFSKTEKKLVIKNIQNRVDKPQVYGLKVRRLSCLPWPIYFEVLMGILAKILNQYLTVIRYRIQKKNTGKRSYRFQWRKDLFHRPPNLRFSAFKYHNPTTTSPVLRNTRDSYL